MQYRNAERAGLELSALSFGTMRFADRESAVAAVRKAIELGVNYFDVAPLYGQGSSEPWLGEALKGLRDKVIVTAKCSPGNGWDQVGTFDPVKGFGVTSADEVRFMIDRSMKLLGVDHLDVYHLWSVHSEIVFDEAMKPGGFLEGVQKAKEEGLFEHIGFTSHMGPDELIRCMDRFDFDMLTIPFHMMDTSRAKAVEYCAERGIAVITMNPLAGGWLAKRSPVLQSVAADLGFETMTEPALRFLAGYPGVTTILSGITYADQAVENAGYIAKGALDKSVENGLIKRVAELYENVKHLCTACGYCGECPQGILIPKVLECYTKALVPSMAEVGCLEYNEMKANDPVGYDASQCIACKVCEARCPNHLPISELMTAAVEKFAE